MTGQDYSEFERGPNGFPYLDMGRTQLSQWESGDFKLTVSREDGELLNINLRPEEFDALAAAVRDVEERSGRGADNNSKSTGDA